MLFGFRLPILNIYIITGVFYFYLANSKYILYFNLYPLYIKKIDIKDIKNTYPIYLCTSLVKNGYSSLMPGHFSN